MSIKRNLPNDEYQAAVGANAPSSANVYATMADVSGGGAFLPLAGGTMTGAIEMGTNQITNGIGVAGVTTGALYHNDGSQQIAISSTLAQITFFDGFVNGVIDMGGVTGLSKTWTMPDQTGTVALVTDIPAPSLINISVADTFTTPNETLNCTSGTFAVTLPSASGIIGRTYTLVNSGTGVITLTPVVGQLINGSATIDLVQYVSRTVQSDGTKWIII